MARHRHRPPFSFDAPFVVRGAMVFRGKQYARGEAFDWQALGLSRRRVLTLWQCASIDCAPVAAATAAPAQSAVPPAVAEVASAGPGAPAGA